MGAPDFKMLQDRYYATMFQLDFKKQSQVIFLYTGIYVNFWKWDCSSIAEVVQIAATIAAAIFNVASLLIRYSGEFEKEEGYDELEISEHASQSRNNTSRARGQNPRIM